MKIGALTEEFGGENRVAMTPDSAIQLAKLGALDPQVEQFRWLLEELRVGLFAQELRTPQPVSVKRLEKAWGQLG